MFEKDAEEWVKENMDCCRSENCVGKDIPYFDEEERCCAKSAFQDGAVFGYNKAKAEIKRLKETHRQSLKILTDQIEELHKANEWHYVKDGDLPKAYQKCYFIYSNTYGEDNKVIFSESNINVLTGIYAFFLDEETGEETTDPCFYDDINDDEIGLSEVYAWKEIVLPELPKESE